MIEFELPYPPSVNHYYRRVGGRVLISREGRAFRKSVCALLAAARVEPMTGSLKVEIDVHPPDRRKRDIDNLQKPILDSLERGGAYLDDNQIVDLHTKKLHLIRGGKIIVRIEKC